MSYVFNEWWEKHYDEIWEAARIGTGAKKSKKGEPEPPSLRDLMEKCWHLATDLAWINASKASAERIVRSANIALEFSEEAKKYSEIP